MSVLHRYFLAIHTCNMNNILRNRMLFWTLLLTSVFFTRIRDNFIVFMTGEISNEDKNAYSNTFRAKIASKAIRANYSNNNCRLNSKKISVIFCKVSFVL